MSARGKPRAASARCPRSQQTHRVDDDASGVTHGFGRQGPPRGRASEGAHVCGVVLHLRGARRGGAQQIGVLGDDRAGSGRHERARHAHLIHCGRVAHSRGARGEGGGLRRRGGGPRAVGRGVGGRLERGVAHARDGKVRAPRCELAPNEGCCRLRGTAACVAGVLRLDDVIPMCDSEHARRSEGGGGAHLCGWGRRG